MRWIIGKGLGVPFRMGGSQNWSSYWLTRYPSNLTFESISDTEIDLSWTNNGVQDFDGIIIERCTDNINFVQIGTRAPSVVIYHDSGLAASTVYYYRIRYYRGAFYAPGVDGNGMTWTTELSTYITGLTTPLSSRQKTLINTFVLSLKSGLSIANLSDAFDVMYILAGETEESSLKNLVQDANHCSNIHATAFTALEGFTGDGLNDYIDTNYTLATQAVRYTLNSASYGIYSRTIDNPANTSCPIGTQDGTNFTNLNIRFTGNYLYARANNVVGNYLADTPQTTTHGLFSITRSNSTTLNAYLNTNLIETDTVNSSALVANRHVYILAINYNGTANAFSNIQVSFVYFGKLLSNTEIGVICNAFEAYMDANSKGVI